MSDYIQQLEEQNINLEKLCKEAQERCEKLRDQYKWDHEVRKDPRDPGYKTCSL